MENIEEHIEDRIKRHIEGQVKLVDKFGRNIDYIRISVTDRCNLRCVYCMPDKGVEYFDAVELMTFDEILLFVEAASELGIKKIRITGGEPLMRNGLPGLIAGIRQIPGIEDLSITTNGVHLEKYSRCLADAGLDRVNVSLDTMRPERYKEITGGGRIDDVLRGIRSAENAGLLPVKLNMVPLKGVNDDEIEDFARLSITTGYQVRFIELMPTRVNMADTTGKPISAPISSLVSADEIKRRVEKIAPIYPVKLRRSEPARYYRFEGYEGVFGIISAVTCRFCRECNRLRLTAVGALKPCLYSDTQVDVKTTMRFGATKEEIKKLIIIGAELKPQRHNIEREVSLDAMSRIGG
ncbi:MAG: GTP 3',8-cyclase MoaA [Nitrospirae bacterium]|nr:GTP 3',8-cyclase MoaA [Nitrospirota bacterium]